MGDLRDIVFQALGQASMCWSERPKGVFDSAQAVEIGEAVMRAIAAREQEILSQARTAYQVSHPLIIRDATGQIIAESKNL